MPGAVAWVSEGNVDPELMRRVLGQRMACRCELRGVRECPQHGDDAILCECGHPLLIHGPGDECWHRDGHVDACTCPQFRPTTKIVDAFDVISDGDLLP
jgi:hypothetical protein